MNLHRLETAASRVLQSSIYLASAKLPIELEALDTSDRNLLGEFSTERRRQQWLRGRRALLEVTRKLGVDAPSSSVRPPRKGISLTHADPLSLAAGVESGAGIGVDLESWRQVDNAMLRWYLSGLERHQLGMASHFTRLRLWTVKEALYKAGNSDRDCALADFELDDAMASSGAARCRQHRFRYTSLILRHGILSIAIDA